MHFLRCPSTVPRHEKHAAQEGHECTGVADDMRHIRMRRGNRVDEMPALQHPQYAIAQLLGPMNGSKVPGRACQAELVKRGFQPCPQRFRHVRALFREFPGIKDISEDLYERKARIMSLRLRCACRFAG